MTYTTKKHGVYTLIYSNSTTLKVISDLIDRPIQIVKTINNSKCIAVPTYDYRSTLELLARHNIFEDNSMMPITFFVEYKGGSTANITSMIHKKTYLHYLDHLFNKLLLESPNVISIECEGVTYNKQ